MSEFNKLDGAHLVLSESARTESGSREGEPTVISYERDGTRIHFQVKNATNHEIREVLIGLWGKLDKEDREDHINELVRYHPLLVNPDRYPDTYLSDIAACLADRPELGKSKRR